MKYNVLTLAIAASLSATAHAQIDQHQLPSMVVSADFRPTTALETPISLTTIDDEVIDSRGAQHVEEVLNIAPNVNISSGSSRGQYFQIRGIGERSQFNAPLNPSVGLNIDGVDFSRTGGAATLFDIESVEVLRGPQGTKFGTNALAGTIALRSKEPSEEFQLHAEAGLAEYNTHNLGLAVGGTLVEDTLLGRVAIHTHQSDGYMDNEFLGRDNTNDQDELTLRGKLKWFATDRLTVDLSYLHLDIDNGYDAFTLDNSRNSLSDDPGEDKQRTNAVALKTDWQANDAVIIQTETTYSESDITYSYDVDWGYDGQFAPALFPFVGFDQFDRQRYNHSVDLRALSDEAGRLFNDSTDWTIGIYHLEQDENFAQNSDYGIFGPGPMFDGTYDTSNTALYGQLDFHLSDKLTLITGARVERFRAQYADSLELNIHTNEFLRGGKLGLNYQLTDAHFLYGSISRGYKSGGVNNDGSLTVEQRVFDTEKNNNYEIGIKSDWLQGRLITELTAFYTQRRDAQIKNSIQDGPGFIDFIGNASDATHKGIEASVNWLATDKLRVLASLGLLDAEFNNHSVEGVSFNGRQVAHAPDYTFSLGGEYYVSNHWILGANVEGKDEFYYSDSHNAKSSSYAIFNANANYQHGNWNVNVWARNLFDKDYYTRGFFFGNNPAKGYADETFTQFGEPRVAGVTVSYDY
jgi:outer membrane receptor protein involved in Fe transport